MKVRVSSSATRTSPRSNGGHDERPSGVRPRGSACPPQAQAEPGHHAHQRLREAGVRTPDRAAVPRRNDRRHRLEARPDLRRCRIEQLTNALLVGLATALSAGISMGFSEALSDNGEHTGRGSGVIRGAITGAATTLGGLFHSLPFLIADVSRALIVASTVRDRTVRDCPRATPVPARQLALLDRRRDPRRSHCAGNRRRDRERVTHVPRPSGSGSSHWDRTRCEHTNRGPTSTGRGSARSARKGGRGVLGRGRLGPGFLSRRALRPEDDLGASLEDAEADRACDWDRFSERG